jgi:PAS domain S-box-containing protein
MAHPLPPEPALAPPAPSVAPPAEPDVAGGGPAAVVRAVVDGLPDLAHVFDAEWCWLYLNPAAQAWVRGLRRDPDALVGRCLWDEFPALLERPEYRAARRAARERRPYAFEVSADESADGRHFETRVLPIPGGILSLTRDVTEARRRTSELQRWAELVAHTTHGLSVSDARTDRFVTVNPALARMLGYAPGEMQGMPVAAIYPPERRDDFVRAVRASQAQGTHTFDTLCRRRDGTTLPVRVELTTLRHPDGTPRHRIANVQDMREVTRLYEAERAARAEAEGANRAKGEFLAVMSHELRTPINAAMGYADLLLLGIHGPVADAQREALERIRRSQLRLLALVNDVLSFARLDAGQVRLTSADVAVAEVVAEVGVLTEPQLQARGLAYRVEAPADGPPAVVRADRDRVVQILLNLLSNAVKFTEPGGSVTLSCELRADVVALTVRDTGRGIPAEQQERVFEPFVQVESGLTRSHDGTGLGLAISRSLARAMGGELTVRSAVGEGAAFELTLPRASDRP